MMINSAPILGRRSIRLKNWDYSRAGGYYVTLVTFRRQNLFGEILNNEMQLTEAGRIVQGVWQQLPARYPNVVTDVMVVMPNHCHGILFIVEDPPVVGAIHELPLRHNGMHALPLQDNESSEEYRLRRRRMLIPKIVGYLKMNSARPINQLLNSSGVPVWQRNYYEHIIRDEAECNRITRYIIENPAQWETDDENRTHED
jgi:putative transposase